MPTTDLDDSAGWANWLQSLVQNQGAAQPYGPGGAPGPYSGGPNGLMPGGAVLGYHGTTPGQPSMGYPAVGQAAGRPSVAPGTQQPAGYDGGFNNPYQAAAGANPAQGGPYVGSGPPGMPMPGPAPAGVGGPYVGGQGVTPPIAGPLAAPAAGPTDPSIIARQRLMKPSTPAATSTAPPSAAAPSQSPFTQVQRPNLPASGYSSGDRMMTALNLARLFGRA